MSVRTGIIGNTIAVAEPWGKVPYRGQEQSIRDIDSRYIFEISFSFLNF